MLYKVRVMCSATQTWKLEKTVTATGRRKRWTKTAKDKKEGKRRNRLDFSVERNGTKRFIFVRGCPAKQPHTLTHIISNGNHNHNNSNRNSNNNNFLCVIRGIRTYVNEHYGPIPIPIPHPVIPIPIPGLHPEYVYNRTSACCPARKHKKLCSLSP